MPKPPKSPRPYAACPKCGKKSRAVLAALQGRATAVHYVTTSRVSQHLVICTHRLRPDQVEKLNKIPNQSEFVRAALDRQFDRLGL